jgi:heme/copper-type cytochrome/quinol oxidase subunit 3
MQPNPGKLEATEQDPDGILFLLELELRQKRALWQRDAERHRTSRMIWGFSIFVVLAAAFFALFFLFAQASEERVNARGPAVADQVDR